MPSHSYMLLTRIAKIMYFIMLFVCVFVCCRTGVVFNVIRLIWLLISCAGIRRMPQGGKCTGRLEKC